MTYQYRQSLPDDTPLDIVGDVHGEFAALQSLLQYLGYCEDGFHPQGRKLVFVGDLCDRGPDSPAVLAWCRAAQEKGFAFIVLGNHELNILANEPKDGSGWFFDERAKKDAKNYAPWESLEKNKQEDLLLWLGKQPLILERVDIRIVHAAWLGSMFEALDKAKDEGLVQQYHRFDDEFEHNFQTASWYADYLYEQQCYGFLTEDPNQAPPPMNATAQFDLARSKAHPIRALTSGVERLSDAPFFAGGRWRGTSRCAWWENYTDDVPVVIGHYWRHWQVNSRVFSERSLFPEQGHLWHGAKNNVFCVDFSVGARWRMRKQPEKYSKQAFRLAALRWPEKILVFDDGETVLTQS